LFDGKTELQKPPLYYWLVAAIASVRGGAVDEWAVRLPAAWGALGGMVGLYLLGLWRGRALAGIVAALMLATALHYTWLARTGRVDMPLTLAITVALAGYYLGQRRRHDRVTRGTWWWFLLAYIGVALAVLLKGPIGFVLPAAVALLHLAIEGELPRPWQGKDWFQLTHAFGLWWGIPLVVAFSLPWYVWANEQTQGKFLEVFFWKHNFERGFGGGTLAAHPWWFYGPHLMSDFLPWTLLLPPAALVLVRRRWWCKDPESRFGIVWLVTMMVVLSVSRFKRADYLLPAYPGAALFLGSVAERWYRTAAYPRVSALTFSGALLAICFGWWIHVSYILPSHELRLELRRFAAEIRRRAPHPQLILFFRTEAHALAFHVGRPIDTILEWENLDVWAGRPETYYVVMSPENAKEWSRHLKSGRLEEVLRNTDLSEGRHAHPLVLMRTLPRPCSLAP
jgi:4-amino-4-deoxy-L-arabinose transferase-like glycosyltransferase